MTSTAKTSNPYPAARWIGPDDSLSVGDIGFLIEHSHALKGWVRHELRATPPHTNQSHRPLLFGWCGSDNDVSTYGCGMARVERVAKNGRAYVRRLDGDELQAALDELGYPDLDAE